MSDGPDVGYTDAYRTVVLRVMYRLRIPVNVPLPMIGIDNKTVDLPPLHVSAFHPESAAARFTSEPLDTRFLSYSYEFEEELNRR